LCTFRNINYKISMKMYQIFCKGRSHDLTMKILMQIN
jgi:hypothetical protein